MNIFFDLDGTLLDAHKRLYRLYADFARQTHVTPSPESEYLDKKARGVMERDIAGETFSSKAHEYLEWKKGHIEDTSYLRLDTVYSGVIEMLTELGSKHKLFILTSRVHKEKTFAQLKKNGLADFFIEVIITPGEDATQMKTAGLRDACGRNSLDLKQTIIIGDSEVEFGVSRALGIRCISVAYGLRGEQYFHSLGQRNIAKSVRELHTILIQ